MKKVGVYWISKMKQLILLYANSPYWKFKTGNSLGRHNYVKLIRCVWVLKKVIGEFKSRAVFPLIASC